MSDSSPAVETSPTDSISQPPHKGRLQRATDWLRTAFVVPQDLKDSTEPPVRIGLIQYRLNLFGQCLSLARLLLALVPFVVGGLAYFGGMFAPEQKVREASDRGVRAERGVRAQDFFISQPLTDSEVGQTGTISGHTPFPERNHYLVVSPAAGGGHYIQNDLLPVGGSGSWTGRAQFGEQSVGAGEKFTVRCVSTNRLLKPGDSLPDDAIFSEAVTVTRRS